VVINSPFWYEYRQTVVRDLGKPKSCTYREQTAAAFLVVDAFFRHHVRGFSREGYFFGGPVAHLFPNRKRNVGARVAFVAREKCQSCMGKQGGGIWVCRSTRTLVRDNIHQEYKVLLTKGPITHLAVTRRFRK
jgi:hypothetical protein